MKRAGSWGTAAMPSERGGRVRDQGEPEHPDRPARRIRAKIALPIAMPVRKRSSIIPNA